MCTKYRRDVIVGAVKKTLEAIIMDLLDKAGITPIEFTYQNLCPGIFCRWEEWRRFLEKVPVSLCPLE